MDYDVIYIGSGNASWQGARFLRKAGLKILIVEESLYGGTCANRGCNSKALLDAPYEIKALANNFEGVGKSGDFEVDWTALMKFKRKRIAILFYSNCNKSHRWFKPYVDFDHFI